MQELHEVWWEAFLAYFGILTLLFAPHLARWLLTHGTGLYFVYTLAYCKRLAFAVEALAVAV